MKYSFIVPAYNEAKYIARCINSIRRAINVSTTDYEIIVVDNLSTDTTAQICEHMGIRVVKSIGKNIAQVRNCGAAEATGEYLIFIDADSEIDYELWNAIDWTCIGGGALLKLDHYSIIGEWCCDKWNDYCIKNKIFTGCFCWIKNKQIEQLFNPEMFIAEDVEFSIILNGLAATIEGKTQLIQQFKIKTSDRKLRLYKWYEHLKFWLNFWWNKEQVITSREFCFLWYSGRREK